MGLTIDVLDAAAERWAAVPTLRFRLQLVEGAGQPVHAAALQCQIRIEPQRRLHRDAEQARLVDLFGLPEQWARTRRSLLWTHESLVVSSFTGVAEADLLVPCTYDLEVVASKYLQALEGGGVPLLLLFSGTVFTRGESGLRVEHVSWDVEARHDLPVAVWRELMDHYFPDAGWLRLDRDTLRALQRVKSRHGLLTWQDTVRHLLDHVDEEVAP